MSINTNSWLPKRVKEDAGIIDSRSSSIALTDAVSTRTSQWMTARSFVQLIQICSTNFRDNPNDWDALRNKARALVHLRRYEAAVKDWSLLLHHCLAPEVVEAAAAAAADPIAGDGPTTTGAVSAEDCRTTLRRALTEAFFYRGYCLEKLNLVEDAIRDLTEALTIDPKMKRAAYERAVCYNRLEKFEEAIADYETALEADQPSLRSRDRKTFFQLRHRKQDDRNLPSARCLYLSSEGSGSVGDIPMNRKDCGGSLVEDNGVSSSAAGYDTKRTEISPLPPRSTTRPPSMHAPTDGGLRGDGESSSPPEGEAPDEEAEVGEGGVVAAPLSTSASFAGGSCSTSPSPAPSPSRSDAVPLSSDAAATAAAAAVALSSSSHHTLLGVDGGHHPRRATRSTTTAWTGENTGADEGGVAHDGVHPEEQRHQTGLPALSSSGSPFVDRGLANEVDHLYLHPSSSDPHSPHARYTAAAAAAATTTTTTATNTNVNKNNARSRSEKKSSDGGDGGAACSAVTEDPTDDGRPPPGADESGMATATWTTGMELVGGRDESPDPSCPSGVRRQGRHPPQMQPIPEEKVVVCSAAPRRAEEADDGREATCTAAHDGMHEEADRTPAVAAMDEPDLWPSFVRGGSASLGREDKSTFTEPLYGDGEVSGLSHRGVGTPSPRTSLPRSALEADRLYQSAALYYRRGVEHRRLGEMAEAIDMFTRVIELDNSHCRAYFNRGYCLDKLDRLEEAIEDYQRAIELDPQNPFTYYNLGIVYDRLEEYDSAILLFSKAIEIEPRNPDFLHNRGLTERKRGDYGAAIDNYTKAIHIRPDHFKSLYNRGFCFDRLEQYARAAQDYTSAICIQNNNPHAFHNRGAAYEKLGMFKEAIADFDRAIELNPAASFSYNARGLCYHQLEQFSVALEDFNMAVELQPDNSTFLHNRGFCYRNLGQWDEALRDYTAALEITNDNILTHNNRAFIYRKMQRFAEAAEDYSFVIERSHRVTTKTLNNRAYCYARLERFEEAMNDYSLSLAKDPLNINALYNRAVCCEKSGDYTGAIEDYTRVIVDPAASPGDVSNSYLRRGTAFLRLRKLERAREDLEKALSLDITQWTESKGDEESADEMAKAELKRKTEEHPAYALLQSIAPSVEQDRRSEKGK